MDHEELFERYVEALTQARADVDAWWERLLKNTAGGAAEQALLRRWRLGRYTHPRVIAVIREYFLACDGLNRAPHIHDEVQPAVFLGEWLLGEHEDLIELLTGLVYYPIGMNIDGDYL